MPAGSEERHECIGLGPPDLTHYFYTSCWELDIL